LPPASSPIARHRGQGTDDAAGDQEGDDQSEQGGKAARDRLHGGRAVNHGFGLAARLLVVLLQGGFRDLELGDAVDDEGREALVVDLVGLQHRGRRRLERGFVDSERGLHRRERRTQFGRLRALFERREALRRPVHIGSEVGGPLAVAQGQETPVRDLDEQESGFEVRNEGPGVFVDGCARHIDQLAHLDSQLVTARQQRRLAGPRLVDGVAEIVTQASHFRDVGDQIVVELPPLLGERSLRPDLQQLGRRGFTLCGLLHCGLAGVVDVAQIGALDRLKMGRDLQDPRRAVRKCRSLCDLVLHGPQIPDGDHRHHETNRHQGHETRVQASPDPQTKVRHSHCPPRCM
jgi:hypothetical protein